MINSRRAKLSAVFGLLLVFSSVLLFMWFYPEQESLHWVGLLFIVLGEVLPIAGFIWMEDFSGHSMGPGLRLGIYCLFFIYGVSALSLSLLLLMLRVGAGLLAIWELVLLLAFGGIFLFAAVVSEERGRNRTQTMAQAAFMRRLEDDVLALAKEPLHRAYAPTLHQIWEAIKYSNYAGQSEADAALSAKVQELRYVLQEDEAMGAMSVAERNKQVELLAEDIKRLVRRRNQELLSEKKARSMHHG